MLGHELGFLIYYFMKFQNKKMFPFGNNIEDIGLYLLPSSNINYFIC